MKQRKRDRIVCAVFTTAILSLLAGALLIMPGTGNDDRPPSMIAGAGLIIFANILHGAGVIMRLKTGRIRFSQPGQAKAPELPCPVPTNPGSGACRPVNAAERKKPNTATALAGTIVKLAASGWRDTSGKPRNRTSHAARAAGVAAAVLIFSLGAAMLLHPHMFH